MQQGIYNNLITWVINHEMGHAPGITHHRFANGDEADSSRAIGVTGSCMRYLSPVSGPADIRASGRRCRMHVSV